MPHSYFMSQFLQGVGEFFEIISVNQNFFDLISKWVYVILTNSIKEVQIVL